MAAPRRTVSDGFALDAPDLAAAIKALSKFERQAATEAKRAIRTNAKPILARAKALAASSQGTHERVSGAKTVKLSVTQQGAALRLMPSGSKGMAWAIDLGTKMGGMVPAGRGRRFALRRSRPFGGAGPSFQRWRGFYGDQVTKGSIGFVMGRSVREGIRRFEKDTADDLDALMDDVMNRAGVPRG
jgi:hypothetical protein